MVKGVRNLSDIISILADSIKMLVGLTRGTHDFLDSLGRPIRSYVDFPFLHDVLGEVCDGLVLILAQLVHCYSNFRFLYPANGVRRRGMRRKRGTYSDERLGRDYFSLELEEEFFDFLE